MDPSDGNGPDPVAEWIARMKSGENEATAQLYRLYFQRLVHLARRCLDGAAQGTGSPSDVGLSAFWTVVVQARAGDFPHLDGRDELWKILSTVARRKAAQVCRKEELARRARRKVAQAADIVDTSTPAAHAIGNEQREVILGNVPDGPQREVATRREAGYTNEEIAALMGISVHSVERTLERIRKRLERDHGLSGISRRGPSYGGGFSVRSGE